MKLFKMAAAAGIMALGFNANAQDIMSPTMKLDFSDEIQDITTVTEATKPLNKVLSKGMTELKASIAKVKADPNMLNKSEFEKKYATYVKKVIVEMDELVMYRDQSVWAFEDISFKMDDVNKRLEANFKRNKERVERKSHEIKNDKKDLLKLAREVKLLKNSGKLDKNKEREIMKKYRAYKNKTKNHKVLEAVQKQQEAARKMLDKYIASIGQVNDNMDSWFEGIMEMRDSFREMAETKADMVRLQQMLSQPGLGSLRNTIEKLNGLMTKLDEFSGAMMNLDIIQTADGVVLPEMGPTDINGILDEILTEE